LTSCTRVLDLIGVDGPGGGSDAIVLRTAAAARKQDFGFTTTVCALRRAGDEAFDMDRRADALGIDYCEVLEPSAFSTNTLLSLRRIIRDRGIEIVHAHSYKAVFFAFLLAKADGVLNISTSHGWTGQHWRERFVYYPADRLLLRTFPAAIAVSTQIRDTLVRWGCRPARVHVLLNGIDARGFARDENKRASVRRTLEIEPHEAVLGAVGRLEPQKRFDVLLEAMGLLLPRRPNMRLLIAGEGSLKGELSERARRLGYEERCRFLGHRSDVADLYQAFDVLVQSSDYEGTPTVVVEAMAAGVPVVATDAGGTRELIEHGVHGLLVPMRDPAALAAAIVRTLDSPGQTAERVAAAGRRVETALSFETRMRKLAAIYELCGQGMAAKVCCQGVPLT
jgi:glycosyltransferase involved in cell wall biosynthesis